MDGGVRTSNARYVLLLAMTATMPVRRFVNEAIAVSVQFELNLQFSCMIMEAAIWVIAMIDYKEVKCSTLHGK
jgi:hypothetical protein